MTPAKKKATNVSSPHVRVRMYNVGFGDCFLMFIPTSGHICKILIDCGSIAKDKLSMGEIVDRVIADVTEEDGVPRIDVVVATHRHRDHVGGFQNSAWSRVHVREVWMPWTEDPDDRDARRIRETQASLALHLYHAFQRLNAAPEWCDLALNALTNEAAMDMLHDGFQGRPKRRWLPVKDETDRSLTTDVLPGVTTYVLGPSRDETVIKEMEPPAGASYLRLADNERVGEQSNPQPFSSDWTVEPVHQLDGAEIDRIRNFGEGFEELLAATLDKAVNGTSLMLVFKVGGSHLLFPGDAQWGTWRTVINDPQWRRVLSRTLFYKVGHHGSHNATPREFVEEILGDDFTAMIPVRPISKWKHIPREPLLDALRQKTKKLVRSDTRTRVAGFKRHGDIWTETSVPM